MADVIGEAHKLYAERIPWWDIGIVRDLEERVDGLGYEWAERCVRKLLPGLETENKADLLADLDDLSLYRSRPASLEEFRRRTLEIWYRPGRDLAQSAVSKLFGVAASRHHRELGKSLMDLSAPVYLLIEGSSEPERHRNACIEEYLALLRAGSPQSASCEI